MFLAPLAFAAALAFTPGSTPADVPVTFKNKTFTADALAAELTTEQRATVNRYSLWAAKHGYRMDFDAQGRLLLVTHKNRAGLSSAKSVMGKAETWFDTVLPAPERKPITKTGSGDGTPRPASAPVPEDPESKSLRDTPPSTPPSTPGNPPAAPGTWTSSWGAGSTEPDTEVGTLFIVKSAEDYAALLDVMAAETHYLKEWVEHARKFTGFTIEDPLAGAYVENAAGQEEWDGNHELMNRVVQLLTLRRFGQQPNWLVQGIAWDAEIASDGLVYCFPFRSEFVFAAEHGAWPNEVKLVLKDLGHALAVADVAKWKRGSWDAKSAKLAWGIAHHLIGQGPGKLSSALEELRVLRGEKNKRSTGENTWETIPNFELSAELQSGVLEARFGADVMKEAANSMRSGRVSVKKEPKGPAKSGSTKR